MERYCSYVAKIMRFETSHKGVFWCAKYLAFVTFGVSTMDAQSVQEGKIQTKNLSFAFLAYIRAKTPWLI